MINKNEFINAIFFNFEMSRVIFFNQDNKKNNHKYNKMNT
jgi:hypothetical protein